MVTPALLAAYRRSIYTIPGGRCRIGHRSEVATRILSAAGRLDAVLITAWNPRSRRMSLGWNSRRQQALLSAVRRYPILPALGMGRGWSEEHLLVMIPRQKGCVLGRRFRQNAIIHLRRGQPVRLVLCFSGP